MPDDESSDAALRAIANLARVLHEAGVLGVDDIARAAGRLDVEGARLGEEEREHFEMAAHWLRCALLPEPEDTPPPTRRLGVIKDGKIEGGDR